MKILQTACLYLCFMTSILWGKEPVSMQAVQNRIHEIQTMLQNGSSFRFQTQYQWQPTQTIPCQSSPQSIVFWEQKLILADTKNAKLIQYEIPSKTFSVLYPKNPSQNQKLFPHKMIFNPWGQILLTDAHQHQIILMDPKEGVLDRFGALGKLPGQFNSPSGIAQNKTNIYICDTQNNRIVKLHQNPNLVEKLGPLTEVIPFQHPVDCVAISEHHLLVTDGQQVYSLVNGKKQALFIMPNQKPFLNSATMLKSFQDNLYLVVDPLSKRIYIFDLNQTIVSTIICNPNTPLDATVHQNEIWVLEQTPDFHRVMSQFILL